MPRRSLVWQPELLAAGAGQGAALGFGRVRRQWLDATAWVDHAPGWLPGAGELFESMLAELPWQGGEVEMYGRTVEQPRLGCWWKLGGGEPSAPCAARIAELGVALGSHYRVDIDSVGCNLYRDGADSVAFHGDRHARQEHDPDVVVAIVSLGSSRRFLMRPRQGGASQAFMLHPGDLLVMGGSCQRTWQHAIPKVSRAGPRISVTFRHRAG